MNFRESVWDDSEPEYAPGQKKIRNGYVWAPPKKYKDAGFSIKTYKLEGEVGDSLDLERARMCRELTREMLRWYDGETKGRQPNTWGWLIARYMTDGFSAFWDVRTRTREIYKAVLKGVENSVGDVKIDDTDFPLMARWKKAMENKGRSRHYVKNWFTHFGIVNSHGIKLGVTHCAQVKAIRSEMRFKNPAPRSTFMTRGDMARVIERADERGWRWFSLILLLRFEFLLRGIDVHGEWVPAEGETSGITHHGRRWEGGLTWEMFDRDLTRFEKVISKTRDSLPEPYEFNLTYTPIVRQRLAETPIAHRVGPVILGPEGKPLGARQVSKRFAVIRKELELPPKLQIRDARSGGGTEVKNLVSNGTISPLVVRDAMQHRNQSTTDGYLRGRSDSANKVVEMRQKAGARTNE
ncbi:MAG: hypothetical protein GY717_05895 [Rhodobacteraceae bacterium]|nr:hypothetical protein [Paracoccaceae bacterium]